VLRIVQAYAAQVALSHITPHDLHHGVSTQVAKHDINVINQ